MLIFHTQKEKSHNRLKRKQRQANRKSSSTIKVPLQKKSVGFVVRVNDEKHVSNDIKTQFRDMKLIKKYQGQFVNLDEATIRKSFSLCLTLYDYY